MVSGIAFGGFVPVLLSMIGDIAEPDEQQQAISNLFFFSGIGMLVGPLICSYLLTLPQVTLRNIYHLDAIATFGTILYIATQIQETKTDQPFKAERMEYKAHILDFIRQSNFRGLLVMASFYFFFFSIMGTYIPLYARVGLNLSDSEIASFFTYRSLAIVLIRFSSAAFLTRVPIRHFLLSTLFLGAITGFITPVANDYLLLVLISFLSGVSFGATMILGSTLVARNSTLSNRGIANSVYNMAQSAGMLAVIITSPVADSFGFAPVFLLGGVTALLAAIPILFHKTNG
jgi:MFS family permease